MSNFRWESADEFFACDVGEVVEDRVDTAKDPDYSHEKRKMVRKIGSDIFSVELEKVNHNEGSTFKEEWMKNEQRHRFGGWPALVVHNSHAIPSERHLDRDDNDFYVEGNYIKSMTSEELRAANESEFDGKYSEDLCF